MGNGTLYVITNFSVVFAIDARTGKERWHWDPKVDEKVVREAMCCGVVNRGLALYQGLIFAPVNDGRLEAIDAQTGKPVWEARVAYPQDELSLTMAPRIAKGKVIVGVAGGDRPTRGFFDAYDALTGRRLWRFYTIPGDPSKPFENSSLKKAAATWSGEWWKLGGGGAVWDGVAYDPEAGLLYVGTGNAEPWPETLRKTGEPRAAFMCSILAVQVDTGELKWHYQAVPNDSWDFDSAQQMILADLTIDGKPRKVLMQANKNGFYYVIDRITGQFISAQPFSMVTWAKGVDQKTGRPIVNPEARYGKDPIPISPGGAGAHNWSPTSFNPNTGLTYIPTSTGNTFTYAAADAFSHKPGLTNGLSKGGTPLPAPPAIGPPPLEGLARRGALVAWDPVAQQIRWRMPGGGGIGGGTLTTASNLVFQTINDGRLIAYTADKGQKLAEIKTGFQAGMGPPVTYQLDGKQYIALLGGTGTIAPRTGSTSPPTKGQPPKLLIFAMDGAAHLSN